MSKIAVSTNVFQKNRNEAAEPVVSVHDIGIPAEHTTDLECTMAQNGRTVWVIVEVWLGFCSVNSIAAKALLMINKVNRNISARKRSFVYLYPGFNGTSGNSKWSFNCFKLAAVNLVITRHYDSNIVALFSKINCQRRNSISQSTSFSKRNSFRSYH